MIEDTYKLKAVCSNCGFNDEIDISKGTKVEDIECPKCGCKELRKKHEALVLKPRYENYK